MAVISIPSIVKEIVQSVLGDGRLYSDGTPERGLVLRFTIAASDTVNLYLAVNGATSGTFKIDFGAGGKSAAIAYNAASSSVVTAINNATGISDAVVVRSGKSPNYTYVITIPKASITAMSTYPVISDNETNKVPTITGVQGTAPELWSFNFGTGTPTTTSCFTGHSADSLTNYASIPTAWGGAA